MEGRREDALLGRIAWMTYGGAQAVEYMASGGKGGDIGQRDVRTGHGMDGRCGCKVGGDGWRVYRQEAGEGEMRGVWCDGVGARMRECGRRMEAGGWSMVGV